MPHSRIDREWAEGLERWSWPQIFRAAEAAGLSVDQAAEVHVVFCAAAAIRAKHLSALCPEAGNA